MEAPRQQSPGKSDQDSDDSWKDEMYSYLSNLPLVEDEINLIKPYFDAFELWGVLKNGCLLVHRAQKGQSKPINPKEIENIAFNTFGKVKARLNGRIPLKARANLREVLKKIGFCLLQDIHLNFSSDSLETLKVIARGIERWCEMNEISHDKYLKLLGLEKLLSLEEKSSRPVLQKTIPVSLPENLFIIGHEIDAKEFLRILQFEIGPGSDFQILSGENDLEKVFLKGERIGLEAKSRAALVFLWSELYDNYLISYSGGKGIFKAIPDFFECDWWREVRNHKTAILNAKGGNKARIRENVSRIIKKLKKELVR